MLDTLVNVKSRLGITTSDNDAFLTQQINLVSSVIESYCRRKFKLTNWVQTFYWEDLARSMRGLFLYHYPVVAVTAISVDSLSSVFLDGYRLHKPTGLIRSLEGGYFTGRETVIAYTAGYSTIPVQILSVLDEIVSERYNKKKSGVDLNFGSDIQRISIPGAMSIDFDYTLTNNERKSAYGSIIGSHANVLDDWRSNRAVINSDRIEFVEEVI